MFAVRNPELCTKDCICLYVCPTGATATEDGSIDKNKCIDGCRLCVDSCPSNAIYLLPESYPESKKLNDEFTDVFFKLSKDYAELYVTFLDLIEHHSDPNYKRIYKALLHSVKILSQDGMRACGYLKPEKKIIDTILSFDKNSVELKNISDFLESK